MTVCSRHFARDDFFFPVRAHVRPLNGVCVVRVFCATRGGNPEGILCTFQHNARAS
ncbi:hypothetical protein HPB52_023397 [Rhipicephalus sanguineus]|uniref:Uncharacterized protein n=1 Tax=Rhipicephalus sanguineus TaxID=34632 RepID=A0A9D4PE67_RHISA|nr:hypothetical protein HPB52_023397 [Rhipicephalus sanguineus]